MGDTEGTKAAYNPLATTPGGYAGETTFNSVGVKNYASEQDGLDANVQVTNNGLNILAALHQGDNAQEVARAVANSPWGTGTGVERVPAAEHSGPGSFPGRDGGLRSPDVNTVARTRGRKAGRGGHRRRSGVAPTVG